MKYIIDCPEGIHHEVLQLIADGQYASMQDFVLTALQNQLLIEESPVGVQVSLEDEAIVESQHDAGREGLALKRGWAENRSWQLQSIEVDAIAPLPMDDSHDVASKWLFGQVNRVLPVKFGLRILMSSLQTMGKSAPLGWFHEQAADKARQFGQLLEREDERLGRRRSQRLSVGFPIGKPSKSLQRYTSQFLGYRQPTSGHVVGALPTLGFAVISDERDGGYSIGITQAGLEFGLLRNPVLDDGEKLKSMSKQEALYYVRHVREYSPGEADALRTVLAVIDEGDDQAETMDAYVSDLFPEWSEAQVTTNRSGAVGRASDLGLVERRREGRRVRYSLTPLGIEALDELDEKPEFRDS